MRARSKVNPLARPAAAGRALVRRFARTRAPLDPKGGIAGLGLSVTVASRKKIRRPSPGAVGAGSRLRRRYADPPAAALLTGLGAGEWSPLRSPPYAALSNEDEALRR